MIVSPMATGNGAYVVHKSLERGIPNYKVVPYNPYLTLFPPFLFLLGRSHGADLIHTTPDFGLFHLRRKVPLVVTFHNYVLDGFMRGYSSVLQNIHYRTDLKLFTTVTAHKASMLTAVSSFTADLVRRELAIDREIRVIHNGIDLDKFRHVRASKRTGSSVRVLFCGNLIDRKGVQWLLPIVARLSPGIKVYYTSGLRTRKLLRDDHRLECLGSVRYDNMPELYNDMDILLFPTVREGFGLVVAEAMACELPVVATDCSAIPELIDHGRGGFLCHLGDVESFAARVNQLAADASLRRQMGEYNRAKAEAEFSLPRMLSEYRDLFEEILDCHGKL